MLEPSTDHAKIGEPGSIIALLLSQPQLQPFIATLDQVALAELEVSLEWYGVSAGTTLFQQGDTASDIFIVTAGRLGVFVDAGLGAELVAQIRSGEFAGEMAL